MQQVALDSEKFDNLLRCISMLTDICNDVDIRDGIVRQRSNDKFSVFEINLTSLIDDLSIPVSDLKQKLELFKVFIGEEVEITTEERFFSIADQYSTLKFENPDLDFLDNKYMSEEELDRIFIRNEEDVILSTELSETISERLRVITKGFNVKTIQVLFEGEQASITARTQAKDQFAKVLSGIVSDKVLNATSNLMNTPFIIDHDGEIEFKMYLSNEEEGICINRFSTTIADAEIVVYGRSSLVESEDESEE